MDPDSVLARHGHLIGRWPDYLVARELGLTVEHVEAYRVRYGLPNPLRPSTRPADPKGRK